MGRQPAIVNILVFSHVTAATLKENLGKAEYSYFFVLERFLPALQRLGTVTVIADPKTEVDRTYAASKARQEDCVFLCFSPPNKAPIGLACPTLCVFAWEFDTLPTEVWDGDPRQDWRTVLADHGRAITLSRHTRRVVQEAMGPDFSVAAIPVPTFDRFARQAWQGRQPPKGSRTLRVRGTVVDSRDYEITPETFTCTAPLSRSCSEGWDGARRELHFVQGQEASGYLGGFYAPEPWGTWSRIGAPWVMLPFALEGIVRLSVCAGGYGHNAGRTIGLHIGNQNHVLTLGTDFAPVAFDCFLEGPCNLIRFSDLDTRSYPGAQDPRTMGLGLRWIGLERLDASPESTTFVSTIKEVELSGVVYTSVLNPADDRKNWTDMLKAFCEAFRDTSDATLVLKMTHHSSASFLSTLLLLLQQSGPSKCRIVAIHGYLDQREMQHFGDATSYYLNASKGEGLCMPLMEFMSAGVPAIAPVNTAMADYINTDCAFVVESSLQPTIWPHDERALLRCCYYRINQESLKTALLASYAVATRDAAQYASMCDAARNAQAQFSADAVVDAALRSFLA